MIPPATLELRVGEALAQALPQVRRGEAAIEWSNSGTWFHVALGKPEWCEDPTLVLSMWNGAAWGYQDEDPINFDADDFALAARIVPADVMHFDPGSRGPIQPAPSLEAAWYRGAGGPAAACCPFDEGSDAALWWGRGQAAAHYERARTQVRHAGGGEMDAALFILGVAAERDEAFKRLRSRGGASALTLAVALVDPDVVHGMRWVYSRLPTANELRFEAWQFRIVAGEVETRFYNQDRDLGDGMAVPGWRPWRPARDFGLAQLHQKVTLVLPNDAPPT